MRKLIVHGMLAVALVFMCASVSYAQVKVKGYYKKDGTYVEPHYRSSPNKSKLDNWSTKGNVNPYTGKKGTQDPYSSGSSGGFGSWGSSESSYGW